MAVATSTNEVTVLIILFIGESSLVGVKFAVKSDTGGGIKKRGVARLQ
jgi:hypothetical protein